MCEKHWFFNVLKVIPWENTRLYGPRTLSRALNQKIVPEWFSGNALTSTEPLVRIS